MVTPGNTVTLTARNANRVKGHCGHLHDAVLEGNGRAGESLSGVVFAGADDAAPGAEAGEVLHDEPAAPLAEYQTVWTDRGIAAQSQRCRDNRERVNLGMVAQVH